MLEWAGVGFGEEETYLLARSFKRLAEMSGASQLQLFGKIYGTQKDYWVACGKLSGSEEAGKPGNEARGDGVNTQVYWVTDHLLNDWIQLPDCCPEHIVEARKIKHVFTGDLNTEISSNPKFSGKERHFLRAQLARISAATVLCPKGLYEIPDAGEGEEAKKPEMQLAEEAPPLGSGDLLPLEAWSNMWAHILDDGRTTYVKPEDMEDDVWEAKMAEI